MHTATSSAPTTFYFIRHGLVKNPHNIIYGRLPRYALSRAGKEDARRAAEMLKNIRLNALYSSPLLRTRQTAKEILRLHKDLKLQTSSLLTEVLTPFEGKSESILSQFEGDVYAGAGGEQPRDILQRVLSFIQKIRKSHRGKNIAAVTHGDVILFLLFWSNGLEVTAENKLKLSTIMPGNLAEYPATGSILSLTFQGDEEEEVPSSDYQAAK